MKIFLMMLVMFSFIAPQAFAGNSHSKDITVYKNPSCGCCKKWVRYLEENNFNVTEKNTRDVFVEKNRLGVPEKLAACHTAVIDGYVIEGHVTASDIKRLLLLRPDVTGIAVPGMPVGTPGMEKGSSKEPYNVITFDAEGNQKVFVKH